MCTTLHKLPSTGTLLQCSWPRIHRTGSRWTRKTTHGWRFLKYLFLFIIFAIQMKIEGRESWNKCTRYRIGFCPLFPIHFPFSLAFQIQRISYLCLNIIQDWLFISKRFSQRYQINWWFAIVPCLASPTVCWDHEICPRFKRSGILCLLIINIWRKFVFSERCGWLL